MKQQQGAEGLFMGVFVCAGADRGGDIDWLHHWSDDEVIR